MVFRISMSNQQQGSIRTILQKTFHFVSDKRCWLNQHVCAISENRADWKWFSFQLNHSNYSTFNVMWKKKLIVRSSSPEMRNPCGCVLPNLCFKKLHAMSWEVLFRCTEYSKLFGSSIRLVLRIRTFKIKNGTLIRSLRFPSVCLSVSFLPSVCMSPSVCQDQDHGNA